MQLTNLGNILKERRINLGKTQFKVAEIANVDEKHYGKIERNECKNIKLYTFIQICYALNIEPDRILNELVSNKKLGI